jgi:alkanesulfonate monooxygenase SsuD/methylene tetrahydromethanopterin reductase-like flavin-dependent oxidoreductase (luciferase family)
MQFGVFDHMDRSAVPLDRFYTDRLRLMEEYDRCGFYGYHVAEHHATPLGVAPSPGVWLAAVAAHTKQLRFGPLVYLLPLYHPLKLLEEICMLDQMSGGRMMLGVGRGISPIETGYSGIASALQPRAGSAGSACLGLFPRPHASAQPATRSICAPHAASFCSTAS